MVLVNKLRRYSFFKGIKALYLDYFKIKRSDFGFIDDTAELSYPLRITNPKNVFVHKNCHLPAHSDISATNSRFIMKSNSGGGKGLTVRTGNHAMILGRPYRSIKESEKPFGYEGDVIIEEDVWFGVNVTLLSGVVVGRGSTIAAGAVVTREMPPYCLCGGVPARVIKFKWTLDQILEHEEKLYPEDQRLKRDYLEQVMNKYPSIGFLNNEK